MKIYSIIINDDFANTYNIFNHYLCNNKYLGSYDSEDKAIKHAINFIKTRANLDRIVEHAAKMNYVYNGNKGLYFELGIEIYETNLNEINTVKECVDEFVYVPQVNKIINIQYASIS